MKLGKKTKIVCTIGPSTETTAKLAELVEAGMNVMRLNFSHGTHEEHQARVDSIRAVMKRTGKTVAILQDLSGPKIRIGDFKTVSVTLVAGQKFTLTTRDVVGDETIAHVNYPLLPKELKVGGIVFLHDGRLKLVVTEIRGDDVITEIKVGGTIKGRRGVNLPGAYLSMSSITDKDREDVKFGIRNDVDFVTLSFVRRPADLVELRSILDKAGCKAHIIAKIETPEALENIDEIIGLSDGIMVARGDLAIEIPAEDVPVIQKLLIRKCNEAGKPVITATQMLESMIKNPVPTRAEVSDIANAIIDGTDAVMLSEETTLGDFPIEAVKVMTRVAMRIEDEVYTRDTIAEYDESHGVTDVVSQSAVRAAHNVGAKFIVALTRSGNTARMVARYRPAERVLALTDMPENAARLMLVFGCYPLVVPTFKTVDEIMKIVRKAALDKDLAEKGDKVVIVAGMPFGESSTTNFTLVETL